MKNANDKALSLLREYFRLSASRELPLDTMLCRIGGLHDAIRFTLWLPGASGLEFTDEDLSKIETGDIRRYLKIFRSLKNGNN